MDKSYQKFLRAGIDLSALGVERGEAVEYFCTPRGASYIGCEGVDGVQYCFVRGYGSVVFAVSPENAAPDYVHAVARDFADFLRLLLACGHGAAIEQCWAWDRAHFDAYLAENPPTDEARAAMAEIRARLALEPMDDPWGYIHELQDGFDYHRIKYAESEASACGREAPATPCCAAEQAWAVSFSGGCGGDDGEAGDEVGLGASFDFAGHEWRIPAAYICREGLVLDTAVATPVEAVREFLDKWGARADCASKCERLRMDSENPAQLDYCIELTLNGRKLRSSFSTGGTYVPLEGWDEPRERLWVEHYGLDPQLCWQFSRTCFDWARPELIESLEALIAPHLPKIPGGTFTVSGVGDAVRLTNPMTGAVYTLTVREYSEEMIDSANFAGDDYEYPTHCVAMGYVITPDTPDAPIILDASDGDAPRRKSGDGGGFVFMPSCAGVFVRPKNDAWHTEASSLYFEAPERVEWLPLFYASPIEPVTKKLI